MAAMRAEDHWRGGLFDGRVPEELLHGSHPMSRPFFLFVSFLFLYYLQRLHCYYALSRILKELTRVGPKKKAKDEIKDCIALHRFFKIKREADREVQNSSLGKVIGLFDMDALFRESTREVLHRQYISL